MTGYSHDKGGAFGGMITLGSSYKLLEILKRYLRMTLEKVELYCQNSEEFFGESYTGKDRLILIFFFSFS